ncbi:sodium-dependent transporter [Salinibacter grassmerensis]|uniref:sodium-dependent transporter n=1 Tax=Salinibacter grassmerensis TaxID=3040353 RepID=UPI0021E8DC9F|nr:sodium-dependent transporter [Salinibacter grassmerensis]
MASPSPEREQWSSRLGFVLAAAGSAIGLGNIWRFPFKTGDNGGGAFVLIYLACLLFLCVPYLFAELALGRNSKRNPVGAIQAIRGHSPWSLVGGLCVVTGLAIFSYYAVVAGWAVGYVFQDLAAAEASDTAFARFIADPLWVVPLFGGFLVATAGVVARGVRRGIERWAKILMPVLFVLLCLIIFRAVTLPGAGAGLRFYLMPDFSEVSGLMVVEALGQAFFSLSLGMGTMITYGSYLPDDENLVVAGGCVAVFDTLIALMAGLMIFPAVFAMGQDPAEGPSLVFVVLPDVFGAMPLGSFVGTLFFLFLAIAAFTSGISLLEVFVSYLVDETTWSRRTAAWSAGGVAFVIGLPSALSQGAVPALSDLSWLVGDRLLGPSPGVLDVVDFLWGSVALILGAVLLSLFVGWAWGADNALAELRTGDGHTMGRWVGSIWRATIKYVFPVTILTVLVVDLLYDVL